MVWFLCIFLLAPLTQGLDLSEVLQKHVTEVEYEGLCIFKN